MSNPVKGEVPLKLVDGREFTLVLDFEALVQAERSYGKPLPQLMLDVAQGFAEAGRAMLFGALRAKHPGLSSLDAGEMFLTDSAAIETSLEEAVIAAFPAIKSDTAEGQQRENPPGKSSGRNGAKPGSTKRNSGRPRRATSV